MNEGIHRAAQTDDCQEALEYLCEYLDSELAQADLDRLRAHIESCRRCREAMATEESLRVVLRRSCTEVAPASLRLRVLTQITNLRNRPV